MPDVPLPAVRLIGVTKRFSGKPPSTAVDSLDLEVAKGEFLVLLGPSGCGKTTTLRCLAGLERPEAGRIILEGRVAFDQATRTNLAPNKRSVGMVFQSYALWPHMTVGQNICYPLRFSGLSRAEMRARVGDIAEIVECEGLLERRPGQLSGGQQQRVALARALVGRPGLILFDEPLSNLDARLRVAVRGQIHELHQRLGFTAVFVTHDQSEALALADRVAVMRDGRTEQVDTPDQVYESPATEYVASFVGSSNRVVLQYQAGCWTLEGTAAADVPAPPIPSDHRTVVARVRPERVLLEPPSRKPAESGSDRGALFAATIADAQYGGRYVDVVALAAAGLRVHARLEAGPRSSWARTLRANQNVSVSFQYADASWFDEHGQCVQPAAAPLVSRTAG
jgi:iron(III) transport system ATP-binding protein